MNNQDPLSLLANVLQVVNYQLNVKGVSNDELMKHLLAQDKILDEEKSVYLKRIVEQNEEILSLLRKENKMHNKLDKLEKEDIVCIIEKIMDDMKNAGMTVNYDKYMDMVNEKVYNIKEEDAMHIVKSMKPSGEMYTMDTVKKMLEANSVPYDTRTLVRYYLTMNMYGNDAKQVAEENNMPVDKFCFVMAKSFINDVDANKYKVEKYFTETI